MEGAGVLEPTLYSILGVAPNVSQAELARAHDDQLARLRHEVATSPTLAGRAAAERALEELRGAWEVLGESEGRAMYDQIALPGPRVLHHAPEADPGAPVPPPDPGRWLANLPPPPTGPVTRGRPPERRECRFCGSLPTADVTLRREQGMLILRQRHVLEGSFCRSCGLASFRQMMDDTLTGGWWGMISFVVNWTTIARNLAARRRIVRLAEPEPNPDVAAPYPAPLDPGRPVLRRSGAVVLGLVVLGIAAAVGTIALAGPPPQEPGFEVQTPSATVPPPSRTPPSGSCVQLSPD
ncbi:MAG: hypothetical protein KF703_20090, partial [Actinobacteria bacterium]|nr:hypothetical protein [Actinomycetota bacterium]